MTDPWSVLGLQPGASADEVKKAYKTLAKKYHPDVAGNSPEAARRMQEINAAYDQIINHRESSSYGGYSSSSSYGYGGDSGEPIELGAAISYINARRYREALNALSAIPAEKRTARWYYLSSYAKYFMGDTQGAISDIDEAIRRDPNSMQYMAFRNRITGQRQQYTAYTGTYGRPAGSMGGFCLNLCMMMAFFRFCFCWI